MASKVPARKTATLKGRGRGGGEQCTRQNTLSVCDRSSSKRVSTLNEVLNVWVVQLDIPSAVGGGRSISGGQSVSGGGQPHNAIIVWWVRQRHYTTLAVVSLGEVTPEKRPPVV